MQDRALRTTGKRMRIALLSLVLCLLAAACSSAAPSDSPSPTATGTPAPSPSLAPTATPVTQAPTPGPAEVDVAGNRAVANFPESISFTLEASSPVPLSKINLEYGTTKRTLVSEFSKVEPEYAPGNTIRASYTWEMKRTGSIPPGTEVWWRWRIRDEDDRTYVTQQRSLVFEDTRFEWFVDTGEYADLHWHSLGADLVQELRTGAESKLGNIELNVEFSEERKPKVFVYADSAEIRNAVLFTQEWTGALAYPDYSTILVPVGPGSMEWGERALVHEITHLMVGEATFGPFGDVPTWLNEGLAEYSGGDFLPDRLAALDQAIADGELLSLRSIGASFPTDPSRALLAYAQSGSVISYLIETYGWPSLRELLSVFQEGSTYDNALLRVYSLDTDALEQEWLAYVGAD